jgi:hypothetical protein
LLRTGVESCIAKTGDAKSAGSAGISVSTALVVVGEAKLLRRPFLVGVLEQNVLERIGEVAGTAYFLLAVSLEWRCVGARGLANIAPQTRVIGRSEAAAETSSSGGVVASAEERGACRGSVRLTEGLVTK